MKVEIERDVSHLQNKMLQEQVNDLTAMAEEYERAEQEAQTAASALKNNIVG